jgi:DNA-binding response OmpR family regulator
MRVLVVDDDTELLELVERALVRDGQEVDTATSAEEAIQSIRRNPPDILVLDLGLPGLSGEELCGRLRTASSSPAILILTAQSAVASRVRCLDAGADDYITKPFAVAELRARVRALARRAIQAPRAEAWSAAGVELDFAKRRALRDGKEAPITSGEWVILEALVARPGAVVSRTELLQRGGTSPGRAAGASLEVLIGRIRRKLGDDLVRTVRGEGYALVVPTSEGKR